jgi:hypothetical protein
LVGVVGEDQPERAVDVALGWGFGGAQGVADLVEVADESLDVVLAQAAGRRGVR